MAANDRRIDGPIRMAWPILLCTGLAVSGCATPGSKGKEWSPDRELGRLATLMAGSFASTAQHEADPENFLDIRLHMVPIWTARRDGKWLYVEQAAAANTERPYRQRVYKLARGAEGALESRVFELPGDPLAYAGAWRETRPLVRVSPEQLIPREGCAIVLRPTAAGGFEGSTRGRECLSTLRGSAYAMSEVMIEPWGMRTWDRGFDADGKQVWGSTAGPYEFRRISSRDNTQR